MKSIYLIAILALIIIAGTGVIIKDKMVQSCERELIQEIKKSQLQLESDMLEFSLVFPEPEFDDHLSIPIIVHQELILNFREIDTEINDLLNQLDEIENYWNKSCVKEIRNDVKLISQNLTNELLQYYGTLCKEIGDEFR